MDITIVRHGQTDLNRRGFIQGSKVDPELSIQGRAQAEDAASRFDVSDFDLVYTSPMRRARQTAELFVQKKLPILTDDRLKEMDFGSWDGADTVPLRQKHPDAFDSEGLLTAAYHQYAPDGESHEELHDRLASFLMMLEQQDQAHHVLLFCHGVVERMICAHYFTDGDIGFFDQIDNCALSKIRVTSGKARLLFYDRIL